jgi:hypothetical protein
MKYLDNDFNISKLNLSWKADRFEKNVVYINLRFDFPLDISPDIIQDKLFIDFN